ncbi:hypothetical protein GPECTOR_79g110 [Gonium pectorale]|uniref:SAM-dependent MTase RsmB/NOP-type domain-containing protein n=1 Tax=Gonium pectorale TaxID=33097 RepID=A0A150G1Z5_GONPE|nr:hypothetical protein GPECTOR_79g110 [Gonium pectorale]|eukprot:KXZ43831.1 hypothetical protein GPECTOR_79g110 [Gonium pectorale]
MGSQGKDFQPNVLWDPEVAAYLRDALGNRRFEITAAALASPPTTTCLRVNTLKTSTEAVVSLLRQRLGPEWPEDTVRVHPQVPCAVLLRGSGPHPVDYGPAGAKEVLVSRKAGEAVLRGAAVYAPGVLAVSSGVARGELVAVTVARERPGSTQTLHATAELGEEAEAAETEVLGLEPAPGAVPGAAAPAALPPGWTDSSQGPVAPRAGMYVGVARTAMSRQEMFRARQGLALSLVEPVFRVPPAADMLPEGWAMLQNLPSLVAALALAPTRGSRVLDMCAAPGGKATLLAQIMGDQGEVRAGEGAGS